MKKIDIDHDLIKYLYINCNLTGPEIGDMLKCSNDLIYNVLRKENILAKKVPGPTAVLIDKELLEYLYVDCDLVASEIMDILKCSKKVVYNNLHRYNIPTRTKSEASFGEHSGMIGRHHTEETKSRIKIATSGDKNHNYGIHFSEEITSKMSKSAKGRIVSNETKRKLSKINTGKKLSSKTRQKISIGNTGKKMSKEACQKISKANKLNRLRGKYSPLYGKVLNKFGGIGKGSYYYLSGELKIWTRSTYEYRVIDILVKNNINFKYESKCFPLGDTTYTPDIYLCDLDMYLEIKGYLSKENAIKYKMFLSYYPDINIRLLFKEDIEHMEKSIDTIIDWRLIGIKMSEVV